MKKTHRVIGDGCIWKGISLMNTCWVSQSVFYEVLNTVNDDVFKRKSLFNGETMFHSALKRILKSCVILLLEVKDLIQIIVKFRAEKILCTFLSWNIFLRGMKYQLRKQLSSFENETSWVFSALKSTSHFLPQSIVSRRSDSSSEAKKFG